MVMTGRNKRGLRRLDVKVPVYDRDQSGKLRFAPLKNSISAA